MTRIGPMVRMPTYLRPSLGVGDNGSCAMTCLVDLQSQRQSGSCRESNSVGDRVGCFAAALPLPTGNSPAHSRAHHQFGLGFSPRAARPYRRENCRTPAIYRKREYRAHRTWGIWGGWGSSISISLLPTNYTFGLMKYALNDRACDWCWSCRRSESKTCLAHSLTSMGWFRTLGRTLGKGGRYGFSVSWRNNATFYAACKAGGREIRGLQLRRERERQICLKGL